MDESASAGQERSSTGPEARRQRAPCAPPRPAAPGARASRLSERGGRGPGRAWRGPYGSRRASTSARGMAAASSSRDRSDGCSCACDPSTRVGDPADTMEPSGRRWPPAPRRRRRPALVFAGIPDRFPGIRWALFHTGGGIPFLAGRLDPGYEAYPRCRRDLHRPPSEVLREFWYDTVNFDPRCLRLAVDFAGPDRILAGSDKPHMIGSLERMKESIDAPELEGDDRRGVLGRTPGGCWGWPEPVGGTSPFRPGLPTCTRPNWGGRPRGRGGHSRHGDGVAQPESAGVPCVSRARPRLRPPEGLACRRERSGGTDVHGRAGSPLGFAGRAGHGVEVAVRRPVASRTQARWQPAPWWSRSPARALSPR